jgi:hypothetical protein
MSTLSGVAMVVAMECLVTRLIMNSVLRCARLCRRPTPSLIPVIALALSTRSSSGKGKHVSDTHHFPWISSQNRITMHQSLEQRLAPEHTDETMRSNDLCRLHHEIVQFTSYVLPTPQEKAARHGVYMTITNVLQRRFPKAEVNLFGSVAYDLCLPDRSVTSSTQDQIQVDAINREQ